MASFGNAAVDIDMLEKEIAAKEEARRNQQPQSEPISGNIAGMSSQPARRTAMHEVSLEADFDTLDEPVWDTVRRDLRTIGAKLSHVVFPHGNKEELVRDWDLWGPLFICVALSLLLQHNVPDGSAPQFTQVFTITFFGSVAVTANIKLLGGHISFFQSLCVIGYCLLPALIAAILCTFIFHSYFIARLLLTAIAFVWSTYASMGFLAGSQPEKKRILAVYPIFLFYFVISWMIVSHS